MKEFEVTQKETILVAKNFNGYIADRTLLEELNKTFGLNVKPLSSSSAWLYTRRRMARRKYEIGEVVISGNEKVGYVVLADSILIARAVLAGEELIVSPEYPPELEDKHHIIDTVVADLENVYQMLLNRVTTEKITEVTSLFFRKQGATPLRPQRGDFYLLRDTQELRRFMNMVEEANLNRRACPHCFIVTKLDRSTIDVLRTSIRERLSSLESRLRQAAQQKKDSESTYRNIINDARDFLVAIENLGIYLLTEAEIENFKARIGEIIKRAESERKKLAGRGVYRRRVW
jgi:hypothetical protein